MKRKEFIKTSLALMISPLVCADLFSSVRTDAYNIKPVRIGFIGCGGRGTSVISEMSRNSNLHIIALADLFQDKLDRALETVNKLNLAKGLSAVKPENIYRGESAYKQLLANKDVDAVLISTPAYAHPFIFEAAVKENKHIYCEKPSAHDVYGTLKILECSSGISDKSVTFGYQIRYASPFQEMVKRIHDGAIGDIVTVQLFYNSCEVPQNKPIGTSDDEFRIRNHFHFLNLSGGILNDQAIHMLDVCNWVLESTPMSAIGLCNKKGNLGFGDTYTNYQIIYEYPKSINVALQCYQVGPEFGDVSARFIGTKGWAETHYSGGVFIKGEHPWKAENGNGIFDADTNKGKSFVDSIQSKRYINEIKAGTNSTLTALLGREAAISGKKVYWDDLIAKKENLSPNLNLKQF
ncbi:Gfo/Idh/MocA family oxidoreductase [Bacteroides sp.]|uniref:Gfo/Idh/MocA family protein n=1 Tax=Bacteroides sp. TaxID=29523 RepID=UPI00262C5003|nr:Gfo/Idh/MocA family oxidoreductase [Bacteroides sp.]MDD3037577.1 Gfo/Idh/MocA family oxidoreductase [Bacteroides sp.]